MGDFFLQYGLFSAKVLTFLVFITIAFAFLISLVANKSKEKETLEIEKINEKYEDLKETLEEEILSKEDYKTIMQSRKKLEKKDKCKGKKKRKLFKKGKSKELESHIKEKLFVLRFDGDMHASEVDSLRESISAILQIANEKDEFLLVLDSSGGMVHNYGLAASQLRRIKEKNIKLTVAVDLVAASGGYMMACVADKIIAAPFAVLGSIGVYAQIPNFHRLLNKNNIDIEHHTAGKYKTTITMLSKPTKEGREKFIEELEETHQLFKVFVKENRPQVDVEKIATGEHWFGTKAKEIKLIDELITSDDYILNACQDKDVFEVTYTFNETLKEKISSLIEGSLIKVIEKIWQKSRENISFK